MITGDMQKQRSQRNSIIGIDTVSHQAPIHTHHLAYLIPILKVEGKEEVNVISLTENLDYMMLEAAGVLYVPLPQIIQECEPGTL